MSKENTQNNDSRDIFLDGNELIEQAIAEYHRNKCKETIVGVMMALRERMHKDGHLLFPVEVKEDDETQFTFLALQMENGEHWEAAFTSQEEFDKGPKSKMLSFFIDEIFRGCLGGDSPGIILNPWGQPFKVSREMMQKIFDADGGEEYFVPGDPITPELLADGSFLKRAAGICRRNETVLNLLKLTKILRDSNVWVPCTAILSEADQANVEAMVKEAEEKGGLGTLTGQSFVTQDQVRLVPDILKNENGEYFFPVFSSVEEMGEYGKGFSHVEHHFLTALTLAKNNKMNVKGIVINAFSEPYVIKRELFEQIAEMPSAFEEEA